MKKNKNIFVYIDLIFVNFFVFLIKLYQKTLSFDHGFLKVFYPHGYCRFFPTCSEYAIDSLKKYGLIKGSLKAFWRILRCNPWNKGGFDKA